MIRAVTKKRAVVWRAGLLLCGLLLLPSCGKVADEIISQQHESTSSELLYSQGGSSNQTNEESRTESSGNGESSQKPSEITSSAASSLESGSSRESSEVVSSGSDLSSSSQIQLPDISDSYPYYIRVNKQQNCVTIYKKGSDGKFTIPVKAMVCSTGADTPLGTFRTSDQYTWRALIHNVYGQYATRITGSILFHSVPYEKMNKATLQADEYNKLGTSASAGCVRLTVEDAKWILDNCPKGTTVTIYKDSNPGPLGKPVAQKIPSDSKWDPTDPDSANPWKNQAETPQITGVKNQKVELGSAFYPLSGVSARDGNGTDLTDAIQITGSVNTKKAGVYSLQYKVIGSSGKMATASASITVEDTVAPVVTVHKSEIGEKETVNDKYVLSWADAEDLSGIQSFTASVTEKNPWTYEIVYTATDRSGLRSIVKKSLQRLHFGELKGVTDREVASVEEVLDISGITGTDKGIEKAVHAHILQREGNLYRVEYSVEGTQCTAQASITVTE